MLPDNCCGPPSRRPAGHSQARRLPSAIITTTQVNTPLSRADGAAGLPRPCRVPSASDETRRVCPIDATRNNATCSNPVYLASRVARIASDRRWAGGIHREHLLELLRCDRRSLDQAIAIACKRNTVSVSRDWVIGVLPATAPKGDAA